MNQALKMALEVGPLLLFFVVNAKMGIFAATAVFMVAIVVSLGYSYLKLKHIPTLPLVTGVVVLVFGGLTLYLEDEMFIKIKPTIVNTLFGLVLFGGLMFKKSYLKSVLDTALSLDDEGWRKLTWRWAWFFLALAVLNEVVWRTQTTDMWVNFKVFAIMPLTIVFSLTQLPLIFRHQIEDKPAEIET
ncbi:septation protein A [Magnetovibrio sp.]|uniref:septation protein A n=1 Tax=Magnetovibrio sp. TaxID=2024836 RepID=UPI002F95DF92